VEKVKGSGSRSSAEPCAADGTPPADDDVRAHGTALGLRQGRDAFLLWLLAGRAAIWAATLVVGICGHVHSPVVVR
jgi:hypothetical protein